MDTSRFEQVINDSCYTQDDKFIDIIECLKEIHKENQQLQAQITPGLFKAFKNRVNNLDDIESYLAVIVAIVLGIPGLLLTFLLLLSIIMIPVAGTIALYVGGERQGVYVTKNIQTEDHNCMACDV